MSSADELLELFVTRKLLMEGTCTGNKAMSRKDTTRQLMHMGVYEAMSVVWWSAFEDWCLSLLIDFDSIIEVRELLERLGKALSCLCLRGKFDDSRQEFLTHQLWMSFILEDGGYSTTFHPW